MLDLANYLTALLGPDAVSVNADDLAVHSTDKWFASNPPEVVVSARSSRPNVRRCP